MTAKQMVGLLSDIHIQHEKLLDLSVQKTETLKKNDIKSLDHLLSLETQCIQRIESLEDNRVREVELLLNRNGIVADENPALAQLLRFFDEEDQEQLIAVQEKLKVTIQQLQEQNELNNELTRQSLQFVNASLSLMEPKKPTGNYRRPGQAQQKNSYQKQQSIFDSKA
ncbi:flagellar protein FlgN [Pseudalkalibacillus sp. Hm43]|uniref:flagellar protein FlgN n=1 Tax=Pseudalkalibacillus sp. Hm43 TaxID=3450742 RepID=UPI003F43714B